MSPVHRVGVAVVMAGLTVGGAAVGAAEIDSAALATATATRIGNQTSTPQLPPPSAQYRVTVISDWSAASHPATLPPNSHFSPAVIAVHGQPGQLFEFGRIASRGIEVMAETGATSTLLEDVNADDLVTEALVGSSIFGAGQNSFEVTATQADDLVSVVTMLAPSPDWFVGVSDVELFVDQTWLDRIELDLSSYDAGTDSGTTWNSPNADTVPAQLISGPRDASFAAAAAEGRFGRVVIERL